MPGPALATVMDRLAHEGWRASQGLPDLVVLPGEPVELPAAPALLSSDLVLAEIKGPGDQVRDEQAVWFRRLAHTKVRVELWRVERTEPDPPGDPE